jgi:hypothetical protein
MKALLMALFVLLSLSAIAQDEPEKVVSEAEKKAKKELQKKLKEIVKKNKAAGQNVVVIAVPEKDMPSLFPDDPKKRVKFESKVVIADGESVFNGKIAPGGQSTLTASTPNLRVKKLKQKKGEVDAIVGVQNIDGTTRINPMTMDNTYMATNYYQQAVNEFQLLPDQAKLHQQFAKVIYVPYNEAFVPLEDKARQAGLHLVNHHPVKFLANAQTDTYSVEAVARSRYNVVNVQEKLKLVKPDPETITFSSMTAEKKATPYRAELSWSSGDEATQQLKTMLNELYAAPLNHKGPELYREMSRLMDTEQMFKFLALNQMLQNGDISDEYFWFTQKDKATGKVKLRLMPQDGDDLMKGSHVFPFNGKQTGLIVKDKLGISKDLIFNYEDPLFRTIKNDPYVYREYLKTYRKVADEFVKGNKMTNHLRSIKDQLTPYWSDQAVTGRGVTDEVGKAYGHLDLDKRYSEISQGVEQKVKDSMLVVVSEEKKADKAISKLTINCFKSKFKALARVP